MWFYRQKTAMRGRNRNTHLTNILLNFHDEIFLWSTTSEGKSHSLPRSYTQA